MARHFLTTGCLVLRLRVFIARRRTEAGSYPVAVIVPGATSNRLADLRPLVPKLLAAIERAQPGIAEFIGAD